MIRELVELKPNLKSIKPEIFVLFGQIEQKVRLNRIWPDDVGVSSHLFFFFFSFSLFFLLVSSISIPVGSWAFVSFCPP